MLYYPRTQNYFNMHKIKIIFTALFLALFTLAGNTLLAQDGPPPKGDKGQRPPPPPESQAQMEKREAAETDEMSKELNLTPEQKAQIKKIDQDFKAKRKVEKNERREAHGQARAERVKAHKAVMTPEQSAKYDQVLAKREAKHKEKMDARQKEKSAKKSAKKAQKKSAKTPEQDGNRD
jgi:Spy/CpxP family protein refolding chaperone